MWTLGFWQREALLVWQDGRAPIVAAVLALAAVLLGRLLRWPRLQAAAAGLALAAGWSLALGGVWLAPHVVAGRLPVLALAALAVGVAVDFSGRAAGIGGFALAVLAGWWLAGAPRSDAGVGLVLPVMGCLILAMLLALRVLRAPASPWSTPAAALALWGALLATGVPPAVTGLALVPLAASLGQVAAPRGAASVRMPMAAGLVGMAAVAAFTAGRLGRGGLSRVDLAVLAPRLAMWLLPRLARRLPRAGGLPAAVAAAVLAAGVAWGIGRAALVR